MVRYTKPVSLEISVRPGGILIRLTVLPRLFRQLPHIATHDPTTIALNDFACWWGDVNAKDQMSFWEMQELDLERESDLPFTV